MFKPVFWGNLFLFSQKGMIELPHRCGLIRFGSQPMFHSSPRCWMRLMSVPSVGCSGKNCFRFGILPPAVGQCQKSQKRRVAAKLETKCWEDFQIVRGWAIDAAPWTQWLGLGGDWLTLHTAADLQRAWEGSSTSLIPRSIFLSLS